MKKQLAISLALIGSLAFAADLKLERSAAKASNGFGLDLYKKVNVVTDSGNKFLSPFSAYMALAMTVNGASGETKDEMEKALRLARLGREEANKANGLLLELLNKAGGKELDLAVANGLFAHKKATLKRGFLDNVTAPYQAKLETLNFLSPESLVTINKWASDKTNGKVPTILNELNDDMRLILLNAIYFKALWSQPFTNTVLLPFDAEDSEGRVTEVEVPTMIQEGTWRYVSRNGVEAVELPYGKPDEWGGPGTEGPTSMIVVLPKKGTRVADYEKTLDQKTWDELTTALDKAERGQVELHLPNLEFSYEALLNDSLTSAGMMPRAFSDSDAEFKDMTNERVWISKVLQKTFLGVNEKGTEAAAVTAVVMQTESAVQLPPVTMEVDRPYFFAIREKSTNAILFAGSINKPEGGKVPEKEDLRLERPE